MIYVLYTNNQDKNIPCNRQVYNRRTVINLSLVWMANNEHIITHTVTLHVIRDQLNLWGKCEILSAFFESMPILIENSLKDVYNFTEISRALFQYYTNVKQGQK